MTICEPKLLSGEDRQRILLERKCNFPDVFHNLNIILEQKAKYVRAAGTDCIEKYRQEATQKIMEKKLVFIVNVDEQRLTRDTRNHQVND